MKAPPNLFINTGTDSVKLNVFKASYCTMYSLTSIYSQLFTDVFYVYIANANTYKSSILFLSFKKKDYGRNGIGVV